MNTDTSVPPDAAAPEEVRAVISRIETFFHSVTAMHDLCDDEISIAKNNPSVVSTFVILRDLLRSSARDLEICAEKIAGDGISLGYFEHHFGTI